MKSLEKLKELFPLLEAIKNDGFDDDLVLSEPNKDENDYYICFEQIIILWIEEKYVLRCLYDSFKNLEFQTKEEVLAFYEAYLDYGDVTPRGETGKEKTNLEIASNAGIIARLTSFLEDMQPDFDKCMAKNQVSCKLSKTA